MTAPPTEPARLEILASRHFPAWLAQNQLSLAVSTYQVGKLLLMGAGPDGRLSIFDRRSDIAGGWRDHRPGGGVAVDGRANRVVLDQLSMPHSPRLRDGRLWLLDSGHGYLGHADLSAGRFERVAFCPGYARGLAFVGP